MKKNIIVGLVTFIVVGLMVYTASQGRAFQGGEASKVIEDISDNKVVSASQTEEKSEKDIEAEKLKALKDKAGNVAAFKVSDQYKRRCASCHGIDGKGAVGLPIFGQSAEDIYVKVLEYKNGKRANPIMRSAVKHIADEEIKQLAQEIAEFKSREAALK